MKRSDLVKEAAEPLIGGSEDEAKEAVKKLFKPSLERDNYFESLSEEDVAELDRLEAENDTIPTSK